MPLWCPALELAVAWYYRQIWQRFVYPEGVVEISAKAFWSPGDNVTKPHTVVKLLKSRTENERKNI